MEVFSGPRIVQLPEAVVNRMAAGEVIVRPSQAVKELLENSIDARANNITVQVADGGLKRCSVQDDGEGIHSDDFEILCQRFTSSKNRGIEPEALNYFGFRGEALASLSYVSKLIVKSLRIDSTARESRFVDSQLVEDLIEDAPFETHGTRITFDSLFYNLPSRLAAFPNGAAEGRQIALLLKSFSLNFPHICFCFSESEKKLRAAPVGFETSLNGSDSWNFSGLKKNVATCFGPSVAKELCHKQIKSDSVTLDLVLSHPNASLKALQSGLFIWINDRSVEEQHIRKILDAAFAPLLPKSGAYFGFVKLEIPSELVDCNVHPSKRLVALKNGDEVYSVVKEASQSLLKEQRDSRIFNTQKLTPSNHNFTKDAPWKVRMAVDSAQASLIEYLPKRARLGGDSNNPMRSKLETLELPGEQLSLSLPAAITDPESVYDMSQTPHTVGIRNVLEEIGSLRSYRAALVAESFSGSLETSLGSFVGPLSPSVGFFQTGDSLIAVDLIKIVTDVLTGDCLSLLGLTMPRIMTTTPFILSEILNPKKQELILYRRTMDKLSWKHFLPALEIEDLSVQPLERFIPALSRCFGLDINEGVIRSVPQVLGRYKPSVFSLVLWVRMMYVEATKEALPVTTFLIRAVETYCATFSLPPFDILVALGDAELDIIRRQEQMNRLGFWMKHAIVPFLTRQRKFAGEATSSVLRRSVLDRFSWHLASLKDLYRVFERC